MFLDPEVEPTSRTVVVDTQRQPELEKGRLACVMHDEVVEGEIAHKWRLIREPAVSEWELYDSLTDRGTAENLVSSFGETVAALNAAYDQCWEKISVGAEENFPFVLNGEYERKLVLISHDRIGNDLAVWSQGGVAQAAAGTRTHAIRCDQSGRYRFELRRWPREDGGALDGPNALGEGTVLEVVEARLGLEGVGEWVTRTAEGDVAAVFEVDVPEGGAGELQTALVDEDGAILSGAYYVYIQRIGDVAGYWPDMLGQYDMVWGSFPSSWDEGPFLGNGEQGSMMYQLDDQTLRWDIGCSAAHDHRPVEDDDLTEKHVEVLNRGRHFIGHLRLESPENIVASQSRLSLWDAEASGSFSSSGGGEVEWTAMVHAREPVMRFEVEGSGDLEEVAFRYVAEEARSPRAVRAGLEREPVNPSPVTTTLADGVVTVVHNLWAGGQTAVAYVEREDEGKKSLWLSVQHSYPESNAEDLAVAAVRSAAMEDATEWVQAHRDWWHQYYPASLVSTGDSYWDSFYWVQQYKLACATRDQGWIIDNQGPWLQPTAWNATWWNLNVQLSHAGVYQANRREMGSALSHRLDVLRDHLALNVEPEYRDDSYAIGRTASGWDLLAHAGEPGGRSPLDVNIGRECGNLLWALHNVDLEYRYWQDASLRDEVLYPLLVRAVNYYRHFLVEEADGFFHLPSTHSPEYANAEDCSYDLDLLRWGIGRLLELAAEQGFDEEDESLIGVWEELQEKLVPAHTNETGRMIGRNRALTGGHRHWSHLLAVYPLRTLTPESTVDRDLIQTSLDHWQSFGSGIAGYAFTGASCMESILGDGDAALSYLNGLKSYLRPSTMYSEIGLPVMETPLHGATA
ncbi:MAG: glycosyl hydrolase family 95 catalytic domain-containing protein, partial [Verrucomicrobiales bacterium]